MVEKAKYCKYLKFDVGLQTLLLQERWPSGRRRTPGKCVNVTSVSWVRIPFSPLTQIKPAKVGFLFIENSNLEKTFSIISGNFTHFLKLTSMKLSNKLRDIQ